MRYLKLFFSILILAIYIRFIDTALAEDKQPEKPINVSTLETFKSRMANLRADCQGALGADLLRCKELEDELHNEEEKAKDYCREHRNDERCAAVFPEKEEKLSYTERVCLVNRYDKRCVRQLERIKRTDKKNREYCRHNPEATRCHAKVEKVVQSKDEYMAAYCKKFPNKLRCRNIAQANAQQAGGEGGEFGF